MDIQVLVASSLPLRELIAAGEFQECSQAASAQVQDYIYRVVEACEQNFLWVLASGSEYGERRVDVQRNTNVTLRLIRSSTRNEQLYAAVDDLTKT